jgi:uncharacterized DUF497 family protein
MIIGISTEKVNQMVPYRRIVVVADLCFDDDGEEVIRIISAREATRHEQRQYETFGR